MNKHLLYVIFVLKFLLGLGFIVWTIYMTMSSDVGEDVDNSLMSTYHKVDNNFNNIAKANIFLNHNYDIKLIFNDTIVDGLDTKDMFFSQRVIQSRDDRKDILKIGKNSFKITVKTKGTKQQVSFRSDVLVTKTTNHKHDKKLKLKPNQTQEFIIENKGAWNITGTVVVGKTKGHFMIKTNAK